MIGGPVWRWKGLNDLSDHWSSLEQNTQTTLEEDCITTCYSLNVYNKEASVGIEEENVQIRSWRPVTCYHALQNARVDEESQARCDAQDQSICKLSVD